MTECEKKISKLFDALVPTSGKAATVAGEIVRAVSRIGYRWWNDGDRIGVGYGKETCNAPARFLSKRTSEEVKIIISDMWGAEFMDNEGFDGLMQELNEAVLEFLEQKPELQTTPNTEDMFDYYDPDEDVDDTGYDYEPFDGEEEW